MTNFNMFHVKHVEFQFGWRIWYDDIEIVIEEFKIVNISVEKLLAKIEDELKLAKNSTKQENLREKVYSIKILCELILDEKKNLHVVTPAAPPAYQQPVMAQPAFQQPVSLNQPKKLEMENEANGDSLFDF
jgi:hypothetical protein